MADNSFDERHLFTYQNAPEPSLNKQNPLLFPGSHPVVMSRNQLLSRRAIEGLIAEGHIIVIAENRVLQLDGWLDQHPGGRLAILHMVGRDATDEINM